MTSLSKRQTPRNINFDATIGLAYRKKTRGRPTKRPRQVSMRRKRQNLRYASPLCSVLGIFNPRSCYPLTQHQTRAALDSVVVGPRCVVDSFQGPGHRQRSNTGSPYTKSYGLVKTELTIGRPRFRGAQSDVRRFSAFVCRVVLPEAVVC
ncbi:hypothetical protein LZ31DRAFT_313137 [Colletotrichum somersetense]|nr:hypothetical protein LZ31DRAFT_313137 [Colletotrichum somersetense]